MNKNQVKGAIKNTAGKVIGSGEQQRAGIRKQVAGRTQKAAGDIQEAVTDAVKRRP